jgi:5,10-methylenetetrahydromethanopterin reductase
MKLSIASLGAEPTARFLDQVRLAERLGFHAFFHNDKKWAQDVYVRLGAATQVSSRIGLGISATDPYTRHPALTAQATASIAEMAPGRFRVIMGSGSHFESLPGYGNIKPVTALREAIGLMRKLWNGERVTLEGEVVKFKDGALDAKPAAVPQIYIASRGPMILKLAGEIADGAMIGSFATPTGIAYAKSHLEKGLKAAGRTWTDLPLVSWLYVTVLDRADDPVPQGVLRGVSFAFWSSRNVLGKMIDALAPDASDGFRTFVRDAPQEWSAPVMDELRALMPRGVIDSLAVVGTADEVAARFKALEGAGVGEVVMWPFPKTGQTTEQFIERVAQSVMPQVGAAS